MHPILHTCTEASLKGLMACGIDTLYNCILLTRPCGAIRLRKLRQLVGLLVVGLTLHQRVIKKDRGEAQTIDWPAGRWTGNSSDKGEGAEV